MLPIDFPLVSLANVHPLYNTIRAEDLAIDASALVECFQLVLCEDKQKHVGEGGPVRHRPRRA